jgi:diadenosine tetraphosphate (Ap4A) HIT family hydrolase
MGTRDQRRQDHGGITEDKCVGLNVGMNCGEAAVQTVFHCHVHLIPRRTWDVESLRGVLRHIIAGKDFY